MDASHHYTAFRSRFRNYLAGRDLVLDWVRLLRFALIQGPWQPWLIRYRTRHSRNAPLPVYSASIFQDVEVDEAVRRLHDDAFALGFHVPEDLVHEVVRFAHDHGAKQINDPHLTCEAVRRIALDPTLVEVARRYLQVEPILLDTKIYWTIPHPDAQGRTHAAAEGGRFHYDLPDVKALTVFVYLTDVDGRSGPHVVIRGSQERRKPSQILRRFISDDHARRAYPGRIQTIMGRRGTGWFEDITCYHKQATGDEVRLMLSIIYSLHRQPELAVRSTMPLAAS